ncbi:hypothetical protein Dimus_023351 [Dionaea muscipula]
MELKDGVDDRTFKVNFSVEGVGKLRVTVTDKLKEFMGEEYTDETLVEYVIVLLRNGRRKDEAKNELDVFLGDDSDSFVTWLWDHLMLNIDQYVLPRDSRPEEVSKSRPAIVDHAAKNASHDMDADSKRGKHEKIPKTRQTREWKGVGRDVALLPPPPPPRSDVEEVQKEGRIRSEAHGKLSISPEPAGHRKRSRPDDRTQFKETISRRTVNAPMRLLQFAVRDAVATSRPSHSSSEPAVKRLRSVVSSSTSQETRPLRLQSAATVPNAAATAIRSVAEAAEDVMKKFKPTGNVFDRLSHGVDVPESSERLSTLKSGVIDAEYDNFDQIHEEAYEMNQQRTVHGGKYIDDRTMVGSGSGFACDSESDNEGFDSVNVVGRGIADVSQIAKSAGEKNDGSMMLQYSVAQNADEIRRPSRVRDQDPSVSKASASRKIVNISVNVNTWKPPDYQPPVEVKGPETQKSLQPSEIAAGKSVRSRMENSNPLTLHRNGKPAVQTQNEVPKTLPSAPGSYSTGRPLGDANSRTIFVNNVHFAATKDSLSRHFNKFGEVLKVIILTDPATGQPKGSAYVEFMRKEAAENALTLDGTSFMSRILKVVRKSAAHQEANPFMSWPQVARGSPFAISRFSGAPIRRVFPGAYRARSLIKPGARSLQWKRDAQQTLPEGATSASNNLRIVPSPSPRGLTFVRAELKADAS